MKYGLIGCQLSHSYSPLIHSYLGNDGYELHELAPNELYSFFAKRDFAGINVTKPYKQTVIPFLDELSPEARRIGAVNTVINKNGFLYGCNTDLAGLVSSIRRSGIDISGKTVLILGTGGTSRTAAEAAKILSAGVVKRVSRSGREGEMTYEETYSVNADVIINTTPCGMFPNEEERFIDLSRFGRLAGVIDVIYNPLRTNLVLDAEERGINAVGGLYMLVSQACEANRLFFGATENADEIYRRVLFEKRSIVLAGMPSCGKTSVGRLLAERLKKPFFDVDDEVEKKACMSVRQIFETQGEEAFRRYEREAVSALSKQSGVVIAAGGGTVTDENNLTALRHNGVVVFIDRPAEMLIPTPSRPLSSTREALSKLYTERYPVYKARCDVSIDASGSVSEVADAITEVVL